MADLSGTIAVTNTAQSVGSFDPSRGGMSVYADEGNAGDLWIRFGGTATQARPSIRVKPGDTHNFGAEWREQIVRSISIIGTAGDSFTIHTSGV
jgi:hypothetical protein